MKKNHEIYVGRNPHENILVPTKSDVDCRNASPLRSRLDLLKFDQEAMFALTQEGETFKITFPDKYELYNSVGVLIKRVPLDERYVKENDSCLSLLHISKED